MSPQAFLTVSTLAVAGLLSACATETYQGIHRIRDAPTGIGNDDHVAMILETYRNCDANNNPACDAPKEPESTESTFESCLGKAMSEQLTPLLLVRARTFRETVFPGTEFKDSPRKAEDILSALSDPEAKRRAETLQLRYIVVLRVYINTGEVSTTGAADKLVISIERRFLRDSSFYATVVDIREGRIAGNVSAYREENARHGVVFFVVVPVFFWPDINTIESKTCKDLGHALADFIGGKD